MHGGPEGLISVHPASASTDSILSNGLTDSASLGVADELVSFWVWWWRVTVAGLGSLLG